MKTIPLACTCVLTLFAACLRADPADDVINQMRSGAKFLTERDRVQAARDTINPSLTAYNTAVVNAYVAQVKASIIDEQNHGGWPVRSWLITGTSSRNALLSALKYRMERSPEVIIAYAAICPALYADDQVLLRRALDYLEKYDPFLHEHARSKLKDYWQPYLAEVNSKKAPTAKGPRKEKENPLSILPR